MPDAVGVDLNVMRQASQHVYDVNANIQNQLNLLIGRLEALQGNWHGDAATSFQVLKERWNGDARKLSEALQSIGDALKQSHANYQGTEEQNRSGFSRIGTALNG
ncbi:WXG100 family type VII secretion target [Frankia sp. AiPs1]|uniref:WXG100 family type VII secretion target n=1 Tax=Frankia sp. AiPs1 TaxID=573493 RepID=UPI0020431399|nr:WXG100 family type VII secretion target [Frankia sp. AiPs1]MCM3921858.1 WXG100 family type VII secretion target [Frankia sp. AiPs1]